MAIFNIVKKLIGIPREVAMLRKFFNEKTTITEKIRRATISSANGNEEDKAVLDVLTKYSADIANMLVNNFNNDNNFAKNPLPKLHYDAPVYKYGENGELVKTGWTRTIGGMVAEFLTTNDNVKTVGDLPIITFIDITDIIKNDKECRTVINGFNTGYVKTTRYDATFGKYVNMTEQETVDNLINTSRGNIGKLIAVATIIEKMRKVGKVALSLKTKHWSNFFDGTNVKFANDEGDVPADRIVIPFINEFDWDRVNLMTNNFFGTIENHLKFMYSNAEKHSKYLYSDYYEVGAPAKMFVIDTKKLNDAELVRRLNSIDGACAAHSGNVSFKSINRQIKIAYKTSDDKDVRSHMCDHFLGYRKGSMAAQIRGNIINAIIGEGAKAAHMPKGVMSIFKDREFNNLRNAIITSNPEYAQYIDKDTIIATTDVAKKIEFGLYNINLRINSFACDKWAEEANYGYLFETRTLPVQNLFAAMRFISEFEGDATIDDVMAHLDTDDGKSWVLKKMIKQYNDIVNKLTTGATDPETAYNNINKLFNEVANNKIVDDITEDSNDARFLGFNEMMTIFNDISNTMAMIGTKWEISHFSDFYAKIIEAIMRSAFRIRLNSRNCGFVRRGYLLPYELLRLVTNDQFVMTEGSYATGNRLDDNKFHYVWGMRSPIVWQYGQAPFVKNDAKMKTADYDISYIDGIVFNFGKLTPSGFQADFDGDSVYLYDFAGFSKRDKKDFIQYNIISKFHKYYWNNFLDSALGHKTYTTTGIAVPDHVCFNLFDKLALTNSDEDAKNKDKTPKYCNLIATKIKSSGINLAIRDYTFEETMKYMSVSYLNHEIDDTIVGLTSTMYRETLGCSIGLGDTKFSVGLAMVSKSLTKNAIAGYMGLANEYGKVDTVSTMFAAMLQGMIEAIKHTTAPIIDVDKAVDYLVDEASRYVVNKCVVDHDDYKTMGDILSRIRKGRLNKYTQRKPNSDSEYSFYEINISNIDKTTINLAINELNSIDKEVVGAAFKFHKTMLSMRKVSETVIAYNKEVLVGALGNSMVQKLVGGNDFVEFNKILYPNDHTKLNASIKDSVYTVAHRLSLGYSLINYVGTVGEMEDDETRIGTASVIKILRDRILAVRDYFADLQKTNDETFDKYFTKGIGNCNKFDASANYYMITRRIGNIAPNFTDLATKMGIVVDKEFEERFGAIHAKFLEDKELNAEEKRMWHEMQLMFNNAFESNMSMFKNVFGALVNKGFRDDVYAYINSKFSTIVSDVSNSKTGDIGLGNRTSTFGLDVNFLMFEILSTIYVLACISGNKSLFMLLGVRLVKFFTELYDVTFVGAHREVRNDAVVIVPDHTINYVEDMNCSIALHSITKNESGKDTFCYKLTGGQSIDINILANNFANVNVVGENIFITCWYKHISGITKKLSELGISAKEVDNDDRVS
jgi:hypothetical protein